MQKTTVQVGSNIAFIKYWGVREAALNLPTNNSISMTLADAYTATTVEWDAAGRLDADQIELDGVQLDANAAKRLVTHLDRLRELANVDLRARVASRNNFPAASGIASSASGFAALSVAGARALGLDLSANKLSALARRGSGSASRSIFGGFVEWDQGCDHESSVAHPMYGPDHWALFDVVAVISSRAKHTSSLSGHSLAASSPLQEGRLAHLDGELQIVRQAIAQRDLHKLGPVIERDALAMHGIMMTSTPSLIYWEPGTIELIQAVRRWREQEAIGVYFTIDAGPNLHLICEEVDVVNVQERLQQIACVEKVIVSSPGAGPQVLEQHLF
ncbi:MAG: diphosphomevalonate decarboxylase [Caldilineaceae bacterium]